MLTPDQKELLRLASSKMSAEDYISLEKEEREFWDKRVEAAIATIHTVSPHAFLFTYVKGEKVDIVSAMLERNFYDAPANTNQFASAKKYNMIYPKSLRFKEGV